MPDQVRVTLNHREIAGIARDVQMRLILEDEGHEVARLAAVRAPKDTGAGAASIFVDAVLADEAWQVRISWDRDHYYMAFSELGTVHMPARPFLVPALMEVTR